MSRTLWQSVAGGRSYLLMDACTIAAGVIEPGSNAPREHRHERRCGRARGDRESEATLRSPTARVPWAARPSLPAFLPAEALADTRETRAAMADWRTCMGITGLRGFIAPCLVAGYTNVVFVKLQAHDSIWFLGCRECFIPLRMLFAFCGPGGKPSSPLPHCNRSSILPPS